MTLPRHSRTIFGVVTFLIAFFTIYLTNDYPGMPAPDHILSASAGAAIPWAIPFIVLLFTTKRDETVARAGPFILPAALFAMFVALLILGRPH